MASIVGLEEAGKYLLSGNKGLVPEVSSDFKKQVWIVDERDNDNEGFIAATVVKQKGDYIMVQMADGSVSCYSTTPYMEL